MCTTESTLNEGLRFYVAFNILYLQMTLMNVKKHEKTAGFLNRTFYTLLHPFTKKVPTKLETFKNLTPIDAQISANNMIKQITRVCVGNTFPLVLHENILIFFIEG